MHSYSGRKQKSWLVLHQNLTLFFVLNPDLLIIIFADGFGGTESEMGRMTKRIDNQHCYACGELVKHPADGSLYEAGHIANDCCYGHWY